MTRGKAVIREPAMAVAAAKCYLSRHRGTGLLARRLATGTFHPKDCSMCRYDMEYLLDAIEEFLEWSNLRTWDATEYPKQVEAFMLLSNEEQATAVRAAQGYEGGP